MVRLKNIRSTDNVSINEALGIIDNARQWALNTGKKPTIIIKQTEHFGDTIYATPIIRHYRMKYPDACIVFLVGFKYYEAHRYNPHASIVIALPVVSDWRASYVNKLFSFTDIDIKIASAVNLVPGRAWSLPNIYDQYIYNSGIPDLNLLGGRKPVVITDKADEDWVTSFLAGNKIDPSRAIALEYHSYSHGHGWNPVEFAKFCQLCINNVYVIGLASAQESIYPHCVDGRGMGWRHSAALLNRIRGIVGVSSGMSVLASTCPNNPFIFELNCPDSISIRRMGFSNNCQSLIGYSPQAVLDAVMSKVR